MRHAVKHLDTPGVEQGLDKSFEFCWLYLDCKVRVTASPDNPDICSNATGQCGLPFLGSFTSKQCQSSVMEIEVDRDQEVYRFEDELSFVVVKK